MSFFYARHLYRGMSFGVELLVDIDIWYDIYVNCNWVDTRWQ